MRLMSSTLWQNSLVQKSGIYTYSSRRPNREPSSAILIGRTYSLRTARPSVQRSTPPKPRIVGRGIVPGNPVSQARGSAASCPCLLRRRVPLGCGGRALGAHVVHPVVGVVAEAVDGGALVALVVHPARTLRAADPVHLAGGAALHAPALDALVVRNHVVRVSHLVVYQVLGVVLLERVANSRLVVPSRKVRHPCEHLPSPVDPVAIVEAPAARDLLVQAEEVQWFAI
mmetsp:Transcript_13999/g.29912  ORF Transcript_13999/g.29912 Transcript_13999/m.29912 type:complete len:228 (-) Transcript_13999:1313-1996(-)